VSARDAFGTQLELVVGGERRVLQLTAGDGFHAANEHKLVVGIGELDGAEQAVVRWPSGLVQQLGPLGIGAEVVVVEGGTVFRISQPAETL